VDAAVRWLPSGVVRSTAIEVERTASPDVLAAPGQIEQVLVNLITNAAHAAPPEAPSPVIVRFGPGAAGMVRFEVVDRGAGIDPAIRDRIFEPFFTTRDVGQGAGLGLSVSHAIVVAHGGTIGVESVLGRGSTFRFELPAVAR
jgi:two-component system NtrC family sensor kinase